MNNTRKQRNNYGRVNAGRGRDFFIIMKMKPLPVKRIWLFLNSLCTRSTLLRGNIKRKHTISYIRAASQVGVINGVGEVEAQPNALCSKRTEHIFANGTGQHGEGV